PNMAGGYEVRNSFFKGCIAPKDITHIRQQGEPRKKCLVFEGFMDYLSFLTLRMKNCPTMPDLDRQDYVILNSTVNVPKAIDVLYPYEHIHCMLDNDKAGFEATRAIELEYSYRVRDFSHNYRGYSDLNDYLCGRKQEQKNAASQTQETKQETGQRAAPRQKRGRGI
ncbi:MAG: toprim domain-containing protein, partial [Bacteroides sp.]